MRAPWTARRSNQSVLKKINLKCSLEGLMLRLKLQDFGYLMQRADSLQNTLMLGKTEGKEKGMTEDEMVEWHHQLNGHEFKQAWEMLKGREAWSAVHGALKSFLQNHSSKTSIFWHSGFLVVQLSLPYMILKKP